MPRARLRSRFIEAAIAPLLKDGMQPADILLMADGLAFPMKTSKPRKKPVSAKYAEWRAGLLAIIKQVCARGGDAWWVVIG